MRKLAVAVLFAVPFLGLAPSASAVCDPDFRPLCLPPCLTEVPDPHDPLGHLGFCPR